MAFNLEPYRYQLGRSLDQYPQLDPCIEEPKKAVKRLVKRFSDWQEKLYADNRFSLLLIFQGMDTAGKDSTIKRVTSGVNPQGFQVFNFKQPTYLELDHNYLWRYWQRMPERGRIGIFNRSYYEEALVVRVHPKIIEDRQLPHKTLNEHFWQRRFRDFNNLEEHLHHNGTVVLKFFLNLSREEQRQRLLKRLEHPEKHWKFSARDVVERQHWDRYRHAYQEVIAHTHTEHAPWFVIPADHKWTMRAIVAHAIVAELEKLKVDFPPPAEDEVAAFAEARQALLAEGDGTS